VQDSALSGRPLLLAVRSARTRSAPP